MKNRLKRQNKGFTLLEIIVVMIIIGILAAIALPNLFSNVNRSDAGGAIQVMSSFKNPVEGCLHMPAASGGTAGANGCTAAVLMPASGGWAFTFAAATAPQSATSGATTQAAGNANAGTLTYTIVATKGGNSVTLTRATNGTWTCSAPSGGVYKDAC